MSAAPGCEFPNPCPVCGNSDDHADFGAASSGFSATFCPHPAQRGHGTGCCCAGVSRETRKRRQKEALDRAAMRVSVDKAALDALIEYADQTRSRADSQFLCSMAEYDASDAEFKALVDALERYS